MRRTPLNVCRLGLAGATLLAIVTQLLVSSGNPVFDIANFFSYFTIWSNLFAALVLLAAAMMRRPSRPLDVLRGTATLSMTMVGIVFSLLLAGVESDLLPWVNVVLHYLMPAAMLLDWWIDPPRTRPVARTVVVWLAVPLVYISYTFIRGSIVHSYPYPFLDVDARGVSVVAAYVAGLVVLTSALAALIAWLGSARSATRREKGVVY